MVTFFPVAAEESICRFLFISRCSRRGRPLHDDVKNIVPFPADTWKVEQRYLKEEESPVVCVMRVGVGMCFGKDMIN